MIDNMKDLKDIDKKHLFNEDEVTSGYSYFDKDDEDFKDYKKIEKDKIKLKKPCKKIQKLNQNVFLYKPGVQLPNLMPFQNQKVFYLYQIRILIASQYINKKNPQVIMNNIWGSQSYTSNSDAVCMIIHSGLIDMNQFNAEKTDGFQLQCKVTKPRKSYNGCLKNGILSKSFKKYNGCGLKVEQLEMLPQNNPFKDGIYFIIDSVLLECAKRMHVPQRHRYKLHPFSLPIIPIPQTHIIFNKNNDPAFKYTLFNIVDKCEKNKMLIRKMDKQVMYLQNDEGFFELYKGTQKEYFDSFRISKVKDEQMVTNEYFSKNTAPLSMQSVEVLANNLSWQEIRWGVSSVWLRDIKIENIKSFKFYKSGVK